MTNKQFYELWAAAQEDGNRDAFVSDWSLSSLFLDPEDPDQEPSAELIEQIGKIWDVAHMTVKDLRAVTGLSQVAFAQRFCVPRRTIENWEKGSCPDYTRLMLAQILGVIDR